MLNFKLDCSLTSKLASDSSKLSKYTIPSAGNCCSYFNLTFSLSVELNKYKNPNSTRLITSYVSSPIVMIALWFLVSTKLAKLSESLDSCSSTTFLTSKNF